MKHKKHHYTLELTYKEKGYVVLFLEGILDCLSCIKPTDKEKVTKRVFIKVVPYCNYKERSLFFMLIKYINTYPYHLWDSVKKWSGGRAKYSRLLINDSDEVGYVDIILLYRT